MYSQMKVKVARTVPRPFPGDIRVQRKKTSLPEANKKVASEFRWKVARMSRLWKRALTLTLKAKKQKVARHLREAKSRANVAFMELQPKSEEKHSRVKFASQVWST